MRWLLVQAVQQQCIIFSLIIARTQDCVALIVIALL